MLYWCQEECGIPITQAMHNATKIIPHVGDKASLDQCNADSSTDIKKIMLVARQNLPGKKIKIN